MQISEEQKQSIAQWVAEGAKLSDIQSRVNDEFGTALTYMDVRFLVDDLDLELKDQPKPVDNDLRNAPPLEPENQTDTTDPSASKPSEGSVQVQLHRVYQPGTIVSGDVVFSDGQQAVWSLDQTGGIAMDAGTDSYQPSEGDLQDFQQKLSTLLQSQGF